ncbi:MAG: hypothetical protein FWE38_01685 [Firmicutes bacterium]|nr:hypothetical protein [Bacillota bacterium]
MAKKPTTQTKETRPPFQPTFRKYDDMNEGEQAAFKQGAYTNERKIKERLGMVKSRDEK